jgi:predicted MFS family arabinose efflux permease
MRTTGPVTIGSLNPATGLLKAFAIPRVPMFLGAIFAIAFAHAELRSSLGIYAKTRFNFSQHHAEWMFAYMGVIAIIVQGFLIRAVTKIVRDRSLVPIALPVAAAGFGLLGVPDFWWGMLGCLGLAALGMGLAGPTINGLLSRAAGPKAQGVSMGASQSISSLALVVGPMVAGPLFDHVGTAWPFYTAGLAIAVGWLVVLLWKPAPIEASQT